MYQINKCEETSQYAEILWKSFNFEGQLCFYLLINFEFSSFTQAAVLNLKR